MALGDDEAAGSLMGGLLGAIDLESRPGEPGSRAHACSDLCFERGVLVRSSSDTLIVSPPLIITEEQIAEVFRTVARTITETK